MKKNFLSLLFTSILIITSLEGFSGNDSLINRLKQLPDVEQVTELNSDSLFQSKYMMMVRQPLDHNNPDAGSFTQRVFLSHLDYDRPVVFVTEGYSAYYAISSKYVNELSAMLHASQVTVEHRYFGKSKPDSLKWQYLTTAQAAADHHHVIQLLKKVYKNNHWINTGISKGGQTAIYHRYYYPDDVDVSVGYVCPLNFSFEDKRVYSFLENVGTDTCRRKILEYQKRMLREKDTFLPMFTARVEARNFTYPIGLEAAYEMVVLEYPFAFWQWGYYDCNEIPGQSESDSLHFDHLLKVSPLDYFSDQSLSRMRPFFYQAMTEIGYYGYDTAPYEDLLAAIDDNTFMFTIPDSVNIEYDFNKMKAVNHWLQTDAKKMLFIYGENDPWSATAVDTDGNEHIQKIIKPQGSHRTRIRNLPEHQKEHVYKMLSNWLGIDIKKL